ncbi:hypothetical protein FQA39_LY10924 [Lamprigera yunnana]|nr:hypothetical protein FQA39_LY10924 [Lamprigera yunnana]
MKVYGVFLLPIFALVCLENVCVNFAAELISTYSKVARWGPNNTVFQTEARSNDQMQWQKSADIRKGNLRLKQKQPVYYNIKSSPSKVDSEIYDTVPAKGEVQERFNPKPYFDFVFEDPPKQNKPNSQTIKNHKLPSKNLSNKPPTIVYGAPLDGSLSQPLDDLYLSPFSSYNPPDMKPDNTKDSQFNALNFPPNVNFSFRAPTVKTPNKKPATVPSTSYGVPDMQISPIKDNYSYMSPANNNGKKPNMPFHPPLINSISSQKPDLPVYTPPPPLSDDQPFDTYTQTEITKEKPIYSSDGQTYFDQRPDNNEQKHPLSFTSMDDDDLSPPPEDISYSKFPQYLEHNPHGHDHNLYYLHHNHDVYHEVHTTPVSTTTSTEAPRAGHYSYYYLGRKLWYIPLYFSVYFIVYVTVLILKSIARHKIQFSHYFEKTRSARQLNVDALNQTLMIAFEQAGNKYM